MKYGKYHTRKGVMRDYKNDVQTLCKELKDSNNPAILKICEGEK